MTEYNVGDRVLVPGVVMEIDQDRRYPYLIDGVWRSADSVRPDAGGRDLTANDVADAVREWTAEDTHYAQIAEELNRIARGDAADDERMAQRWQDSQGTSVPDDEPCVCHTGFTCTASEHDDTAPGVKCGVCDRPLALADPRYVHADGKTYRHPIRPVPAPSVPPRPSVPRVLLTDGWVTRVNAAQATVGEFLDNNPLAHDIGQEMRDALVVLSSDAHHRYAPTYSQMDENGEVDV